MGFVSAYLLVRGTEVAVVDTGVGGGSQDIAQALATVGLGWGNVGHVIITHRHGDHAGSLPAVMGGATEATAYAGEADISGISSPRPITALFDGDEVFGMTTIHTPGHTSGHMSVFDPVGQFLIAGDALRGAGAGADTVNGVAGPAPDFTPDMDEAIASAMKLSELNPEQIYFGHGEPVTANAAFALKAYLATL
jgi:glyoxylase-like metal-dependent hydrolase (beta-lactamase superfamily II)